MIAVAMIIVIIFGALLFVYGWLVVVLKKYHLATWPYKQSISQRQARLSDLSALLVGPWFILSTLQWANRMPVMLAINAFLALVLMVCLALVWHTETKHGNGEQDDIDSEKKETLRGS